MSANDSDPRTITAIATPAGYGGIGVIRLSGDHAVSFVRRLTGSQDEQRLLPNQATFQLLRHPETGETIDEAVITYFQAPHSFTGEDVIEISCHGSPVVLSEVVRLLISFGAAPAEPGEFSLRAFLNRRIDLAQAEAINDLIHSQTAYQARLATRQLRGELSKQLQPIKDDLIRLIVHFESTVEFVEDDLDPLDLASHLSTIDATISKLEDMASSYGVGRIVRDGVRLALIGRPNVGKSSIFNSLLGRDRAIVTHLPGTTRDTLHETLSINGIPVHLIDTAGIRETEDLVEQLGVERTRTAVTEADLVIAVLDAHEPLSGAELELLREFPVDLYVINKCDLELRLTEDVIAALSERHQVLRVSALTGTGIDQLREAISRRIAGQPGGESAIITNERHYQALRQTITALETAKRDLDAGFTEEIALTSLHQALRSLGLITGETLIGDIIHRIFATFCIGK